MDQNQNTPKANSFIGLHHLTAMTSSAEKIYDFFTHVLGMRLVKKTVNQDDVQAYHLFFADDRGNPGTDMTFFDFPGIAKGVHGKDEIYRTSFRVPSDASLHYWLDRFDRMKVEHQGVSEQFGKLRLPFSDFDDQQYQLISDERNTGVDAGLPWLKGPIPESHAIRGLGPAFLSVGDLHSLKALLISALKMKEVGVEGRFHCFEMGLGGNGGSVIVEHHPELPESRQGFGTVHHLAFRVKDRDELEAWMDRLQQLGLAHSGFIDRFYFQSTYFRVAPKILFELATDGPGFMGDEPYDTLGEKLSLPPFLEPYRSEIELRVRHLDTMRSRRDFVKE